MKPSFITQSNGFSLNLAHLFHSFSKFIQFVVVDLAACKNANRYKNYQCQKPGYKNGLKVYRATKIKNKLNNGVTNGGYGYEDNTE